MEVPVLEGVRGREVVLEVHPQRLCVAVQGQDVLAGSLVDAGEVEVNGELGSQG